MPSTPSSASRRKFSQGKVPSIQRGARSRNSLWATSRTVATKRRCSSLRLANTAFLPLESDEPEVAQARMPVAADDDVVMQGKPEQGGSLLDLLGHGDVRPGRGRVARGVIVHHDYPP